MLFNLAQTLRSFDHITGVDDGRSGAPHGRPDGHLCAKARRRIRH
jgi:hypothetical protein